MADNCVAVANRDQLDRDEDGEGDACDLDDDGDGVVDELDPCPLDPLNDSDGDGSCDEDDRCPGFDDRSDADTDGVPDGCDLPSCGDGVLEAQLGETCEPTLTTAACPQSCDDQLVCTADRLMGSPEACNARCTYLPISEPANDDGCCPASGNALTDSDCSPRCGNGVVEPGEVCEGGGSCVACRTLFPNSLVHRYSFDGNGTVALDAVGAAHGTCINSDVQGGVVDLANNVANNYVEFPPRIISGLNALTLEIWLTWDGGADPQRILDFGNGNGVAGTSFLSVQPRDSGGVLSVTMNVTSAAGDTSADLRVADSAALGKYDLHHVAVTFDGSSLTLYLDGVRRSSANALGRALSSIDDQNNWLGRSQFAAAPEFDGAIYELRIYERALSGVELRASSAAGPDP